MRPLGDIYRSLIDNALPAPFRLPLRYLSIGFFLFFSVGLFDREIPLLGWEVIKPHLYFCNFFLATLVLTDREGPWRPRLLFTAGFWVASLIYAAVLGRMIVPLPASEFFYDFFGARAIYFWAFMIWLAAPVLFRSNLRPYQPLFRLACWGLCLYGFFCLASAVASPQPDKSLKMVHAERIVYLIGLFTWLRAAYDSADLRRATLRLFLWLFGIVIAASAVIGLLDLCGGAGLRELFARWGFVFVEQAGCGLPERRLLFPLEHFNRTGYLALIAFWAFSIQAMRFLQGGPARRKQFGFTLALVAMALFVLVQSYTRSALAALLIGFIVWSVMASRRMLILIIVVMLGTLAILPAAKRDHLLTIFKPSTYAPGGPLTSMKTRIYAWQYAGEVIRAHPIDGVGYGYRYIRRDYERYVRAKGDPVLLANLEAGHTMQHVHNLWLEIGAESGLPAMLAFLLFCGARWLLLARGFFGLPPGDQRRQLLALIGFEVSIIVFCLVSYPIRRNFGLLSFAAWIYILGQANYLSRPPSAYPEPKQEGAIAE